MNSENRKKNGYADHLIIYFLMIFFTSTKIDNLFRIKSKSRLNKTFQILCHRNKARKVYRYLDIFSTEVKLSTV